VKVIRCEIRDEILCVFETLRLCVKYKKSESPLDRESKNHINHLIRLITVQDKRKTISPLVREKETEMRDEF